MTEAEMIEDMKKWVLWLVMFEIFLLPLEIIVYFQPPQWTVLFIFLFSGLLNVATLAFAFTKEAQKTKLGAKGHLKREKKFLILEIPNIIQIVGVLGLLSFYLKDVEVRALLALVTALLLSVYLKYKRYEYIHSAHTKDDKNASVRATAILHAIASSIIGVLVFLAAELLGRQ